MAHWRKRNPPGARFNAYLKGWVLAISVLFGTIFALALHGHV
jgi:hypothetical protein